MAVHNTAIVDKSAEVENSVEVGPGAIIEGGVRIHANVKIMANVHIYKGTEIGEGTVIHPGAIIGNEPQDYAYKGEESFTKVGKNCIVREYATIHRGTRGGSTTLIGNNVFLMVQSHIGHNCAIEDNAVIANGALLAGYVEVGRNAFISGGVVFHQFCRVGRFAMIGGFTGINKDVPPYMVAQGPSAIRGINLVGLKRAKVGRDVIIELKEAYNTLYFSRLRREEAIEKIEKEARSEEVKHLASFIKSTKRGICRTRFSKGDFFEME